MTLHPAHMYVTQPPVRETRGGRCKPNGASAKREHSGGVSPGSPGSRNMLDHGRQPADREGEHSHNAVTEAEQRTRGGGTNEQRNYRPGGSFAANAETNGFPSSAHASHFIVYTSASCLPTITVHIHMFNTASRVFNSNFLSVPAKPIFIK